MPQQKDPQPDSPTSLVSPSFPPDRKSEALLLAWLKDGFALTESELGSQSDILTYRVVSRKELKKFIEIAFDKGDQKTADNLLALAARTQEPSKEMVRKSIRIGPGEYLALYRLKLQRNTSFSDIITDVAGPKIIGYLQERQAQLTDGLDIAEKRLEHIISQVKSWSSNKPESRTKDPDWEADLPGVIAKYPYKVDDVKELYLGLIFGEIEDRIRRADYAYVENTDNIYQHFRSIWEKEIGEDIVGSTFIESSVGERDNALLFTPVVSPNGKLWREGKELEELFDTYGEGEVRGFANTMDEVSEVPEKFKQTDRESNMVYFRLQLRLPAFTARETSKDQFEITCIQKRPFQEKMGYDAYALEDMVKRVASRLDQDPSSYFRSEYDIMYERGKSETAPRQNLGELLAYSENLTRLIRLATKLANTPEDFAEIQRISRMRSRIRGYSLVMEFLEILVRSSLERHNVISFYVNTDVLRAMPLALKGTNWIELTKTLS